MQNGCAKHNHPRAAQHWDVCQIAYHQLYGACGKTAFKTLIGLAYHKIGQWADTRCPIRGGVRIPSKVADIILREGQMTQPGKSSQAWKMVGLQAAVGEY